MPSGWEVYYLVALSAVLGLLIPCVFFLLSSRLARKAPVREENVHIPLFPPVQGDDQPVTFGRRMNIRFFMASNAALVLIALGLVLIPCVSAFRIDRDAGGTRSLGSLVMVSILAGLALLYATRKGDLNWLTTYQPEESRKDP